MKSIFGTLILLSVQGCCIHVPADASAVVAYAKARQAERSVQNLLWYQGSDDTHDYFKYVFSMAGERCFAVPTGQIVLVHRYPRTADHTQWQPVSAIGDFRFYTPAPP